MEQIVPFNNTNTALFSVKQNKSKSKLTYLALTLSLFPIMCLAQENESAPPKFTFMVNKFGVEGDSTLSEEELADYFKPLEQKSYDLQSLQQVGKVLETKIRHSGYAFYRVILPPQSLNAGEVTLKMVSFGVENINIHGNYYFSKEGVMTSLPELKKNESPNTKALAQSVKVANKHPSKKIKLTFKESDEQDSVNANIKVIEPERPYEFSLNFNNTGSDSAGEYRLTGGAQYSNLWGLDHVINASYTLPPDHADTIKQYGATYALPVYALGGWLNMYYASSSANNGVVASDLNITGAGKMMGIHYQQFLPKWGQYEHSVDVGLDSRHFLSSTQNIKIASKQCEAVSELPALAGVPKPVCDNEINVRSTPFSITYKAEYPFEQISSSYFVQWATNVGLWSDNADTFYDKSRKYATSTFNIVRYGTNFFTKFGEWSLSTGLSGQHSDSPLIAGEQLGIGGSFDVRGYEQRETGADSGQIVKVELTSPAWENINAFVFYDCGHGTREKSLEGETKSWTLSGAGVGAKWQWQENISTNIAFATALNDAKGINGGTTQAGNNRIHMNINLRY